MGEIRINIPKELEKAFDSAFPEDDKAAAVLRLIRQEIERKQDTEGAPEKSLVEMANEIRARAQPIRRRPKAGS